MMRRLLILATLLLAPLLHAADNAGEYRLGPGDVVKISVYDHADLNTEIQLNKDGDITFPLVGKLRLQGLSYTESEALIARALQGGGFLKQANVNVLVTQYRSVRVSVVGEVYKPGRYALDSMANLIDVLAIAGGVNSSGGDKVIVLRGDRRDEYFISKLMAGSDADRQLRIQGGDIIYIPRMQQFYVYGEVNRPGSYRLEPGMTVMQAVSVAGGFNPRASHRAFQLHRNQPDGSIRQIEPALSDTLQENDVIYVQESLF
jgi:polysaccharide export outer membrane protein